MIRGLVFRLMWRAFGPAAAFLISASAFGLGHMGNANATIFSLICIALEAGIMLGAFYPLTGRLWVSFDDGRQTFVEFPASIVVGDAPPLFIIGPSGEAELVNYRVRGRFYVVDRIFDAAELRLGAKKQQVVRIARVGDGTPSQKGKRS